MSKAATHSESASNQTDYPGDEIELIDLFRIIWKWRYLILCGTAIFAIAAVAVSLFLPKIYQIETIIRPGTLSINDVGESIYIDTPENIKAIVEAGVFDLRILSNLEKSYGSSVPKGLKFKVILPKSSNSLQIRYETHQIEQGIEILNLLGKFLIEEYGSQVKYYQNEIDKNLSIAQAEIQQNRSIKRSNDTNIKNIEKLIHELETGIVFVNENTAYLIKERNRLLSKDKDEANILAAILYSNTIQQNLQLENTYENQIKDLKLEKETKVQDISKLENQIQIKLAEIENLEFKKNNIQNIRIILESYSSPNPIKPKKMLNTILATIAGIFLMIFLSFCFEYISKNKIQTTKTGAAGF